MAAYTAVISLLQTLDQPNISELFHDHSTEMLDSLQATAEYFQDVLENSSNKSFEEDIRVVVSEAEDVVEMKISEIIKGESWTFGILQHHDMLPVVEKMDTTKKQVIEILSHDSDQILELTADSLIGASSMSDPMLSDHLKDDIVQGLDGDLEIIDKRLRGPTSYLDIVTISGMGGIGKTTLAKKAYDHLPIRYHFDIFVWVTISQEFRYRNVLLEALHCISKQRVIVNAKDYVKMEDNELADLVQKNLKGPRYLVVVDDIWSRDVWDSISQIFPNCNNRSRVLLTTRETEVAMYANTSSPHKMNLLDLDNSWKLLRDKVFGLEHDHPPELEEIGKTIAGKCQGLPLIISVIAGHLSKTVPKTLESWKYVAKTLSEIIASHPNKCLGVLGLSYHHLPNRLKPCFLSMGDFPEDFQVDTWRLIQLWIAEGFIRMSSGSRESLEEVAKNSLEDLISRNLIMARKKRFNGEVKVCGIHDLLREFCLIEAEMTKFMHVVRTPFSPAQKPNFRRFSIQKHIEDAYKFLPRVARSIYCFSYLDLPFEPRIRLLPILPIYHHDPTIQGFFSCFNHLRVLAIFPAWFGSFPLVITKLFHLRYLQVRCFGNIPESISELLNLQTLICDGHSSEITLPRKIWMLKNLRYIRLGGATYLPSPRIDNNLVTGMPNLEEFYSICYSSCTNEVISSTPNLKRLIIRVPSSILHNIPYRLLDMSSLTKLETFKFYWKGYLEDPIKIFVFPKSLRRVSLTRCCKFIWEEISSTFIMLRNLEELKLKRCGAKDDVWRLSDKDIFRSLKLLLLSELNLKGWEASSDNFPNLKRLVLKKCRDLQEIPTDFVEICTLESIELHDCTTTAEDSVRNIEQEREDMGYNILKVYIHNSHRN
ncbi:putative late blight resistance protein homolog R1A-10 isoform X1 [Solanum stenotomum]|uniref:putative late blight resistance protein homolog R1A-10 isoform X1 n=1 Tax=Solanum stenotomum TaxID=172797 RepID=UPI0020D03A89|nr:putative late blight resistance protein homolog R1A-10 isoform X1 [Solanum stenotomum]